MTDFISSDNLSQSRISKRSVKMAVPNEGNSVGAKHPDLQLLRSHLEQIHDAISNFRPLTDRPPIVDSSVEMNPDTSEDNQWLQQEHIPGVKKLRESIKVDLDAIEKVSQEET